MAVRVVSIDKPGVPALTMPNRFQHEVAYFMSVPGESGVPALAPREYWIDLQEARRWLEEGVFRIVSPLDSANKTEIELSEEQEQWLQWMTAHAVQHIRLESFT